MFILQEAPINAQQARNEQQNPNDGALVVFEGMVRADEIQGRTVSELLYVADSPSVIAEGEKIMAETKVLFKISDALCIQRTGQLKIGETAVWIGVWAPHRDEAFKACRYIIEEIKKRLHIWKKEFFNDGTKAWVQPQDKGQ